jgi:hypothetical protein
MLIPPIVGVQAFFLCLWLISTININSKIYKLKNKNKGTRVSKNRSFQLIMAARELTKKQQYKIYKIYLPIFSSS